MPYAENTDSFQDFNLHIVDQLDLPEDFVATLSYDIGEMDEKMRQKYGRQIENSVHNGVHYNAVLVCSTLRGDIRGARVLDLGCGSNYEAGAGRTVYQPWLCRILRKLGARPVGIDIGNLEGEDFEHYTADLRNPDALSFLPDSSFDLAVEHHLFDSMWPEQSLDSFGEEITRVKRALLRQVCRLVKPCGHFITSTFYRDPAPQYDTKEEEAILEYVEI